MKSFESTVSKKYTFSSCDICDAACCDGRRGSIFSQIILEDFIEVFEKFPIAFIIGSLGYLKPVILLANEDSYCRYIKENKCTIYDKRPSICRVYPLSPHLSNEVYIDILCPAVNNKENNVDIIVKDNIVTKKYHHKILDNYQQKYINTHFYFDRFNNRVNLEPLIKIKQDVFYKFKKDLDDEYVSMHLKSLKNMEFFLKK